MNYSVSINSVPRPKKLRISPKLDSGGKPSTLFPPGRLVKLLVDRTNAKSRQSFVAVVLSNKIHHFENILAISSR